jgi:hypothetical protein
VETLLLRAGGAVYEVQGSEVPMLRAWCLGWFEWLENEGMGLEEERGTLTLMRQDDSAYRQRGEEI